MTSSTAMEEARQGHRDPAGRMPLGLLLANLVFLWSTNLDNELAPRLPFLLSSVLIVAASSSARRVGVGRVHRHEAAGLVVKNPLKEVFKNDWRTILRVIALRLAESGGFYIIVTYMLSYLTTRQRPHRGPGDRTHRSRHRRSNQTLHDDPVRRMSDRVGRGRSTSRHDPADRVAFPMFCSSTRVRRT